MERWIGIGAVAALLAVHAFVVLGLQDPQVSGSDLGVDIDLLGDRVDRLAETIAAAAEQSMVAAVSAVDGEAAGEGDAAQLGASGLFARLDGIQATVDRLESQLEGAMPETAEQLAEAFRGDEGYTRANELFDAGKFATAAEGLLTFLDAHPDHPDAADLWRKASLAFRRAGLGDKAVWAYEQLLERYPERRGRDLSGLAGLEKQLGRYDAAIEHASEAAQLAESDTKRLHHLLYRAWYVQLRDGDAAGLTAYREVEQLAQSLGLRDRVAKSLDRKLAELGGAPKTR